MDKPDWLGREQVVSRTNKCDTSYLHDP